MQFEEMNQIVFLRGINVSGQKKFTKQNQEQCIRELGINQFKVYLHTGNWLLQSSDANTVLAQKIESLIEKKYGWKVATFVFRVSELNKLFLSCPFQTDDSKKIYFTFLSEKPSVESIQKLESYKYEGESFQICNTTLYFYCEAAYGKARMNNNWFENKLQVKATTRGYSTVQKVLNLKIV